MGPLGRPPPSPCIPGFSPRSTDLPSPRDVGGVVPRGNELVDLGEVEPLGDADVLRSLGSGTRPLDDMLSSVRLVSFMQWALASSTATARGVPFPLRGGSSSVRGQHATCRREGPASSTRHHVPVTRVRPSVPSYPHEEVSGRFSGPRRAFVLRPAPRQVARVLLAADQLPALGADWHTHGHDGEVYTPF